MLPVLLVAGGLLSYTSVKLYNNLNKSKQLLPKQSQALSHGRALKQVRGRSVLVHQAETQKKSSQLSTDYWIAGGGVGLTFLSIWTSPVLMIPAAVAFTYLTLPVWKDAKVAIKNRRSDMSVVYAITLPALMLSGYYVVGALSYWLHVWRKRALFQAENKAQQSLTKQLIPLPQSTWIMHNGVALEVAVKQLRQGDILVLHAGDTIPADGTIIKGAAMINPYMTTDNSTLLTRKSGERVLASDVVVVGELHVNVEETGNNTIIANINRYSYMEQHRDMSNLVQSRGEAISNGMAMPTLVLSALALPFAGIAGGLAMLQSSMGTAIRLLIPLTTLKFLQKTSENEMWVKDGRALERLSRVDSVVFDINSLLVAEQPDIHDIHCFGRFSQTDILAYTGALIQHRNNPVANAIMQQILRQDIHLDTTLHLETSHHGSKAQVNEQWVCVGTLAFIREQGIFLNKKQRLLVRQRQNTGYPLLLVAVANKLIGMIELCYVVRPEAVAMLKQLNQAGTNTYLISSEQLLQVESLAKALGIRSHHARLNANQCVDFIKNLQEQRKVVCFIGNQVGALKTADVAIVARNFSSSAIDNAHIVLLNNDPSHLKALFALTKELKRKLRSSLSTSILPSLSILLGVFLFNLGVVGSFVIYYGSLGMGILNAQSTLPKTKPNKTIGKVTKI